MSVDKVIRASDIERVIVSIRNVASHQESGGYYDGAIERSVSAARDGAIRDTIEAIASALEEMIAPLDSDDANLKDRR